MYIQTRYAKAGRNLYQSISDGEIIIRSSGGGDKTKKIITIKDSDVYKLVHISPSKKQEWIYGQGYKEWRHGKLVDERRYKPGTNMALIPKGEYRTSKYKLGEFPVVCHQYCMGGGFRRELVRYSQNKRVAYKVSYGQRKLQVVYPNGKLWFKLEGALINFAWKGHIVPENEPFEPSDWNYDSFVRAGRLKSKEIPRSYTVELYDEKGEVITKGQVERRQKTGIWIEGKETVYYIQGVGVSKKLFETKPEDLDPKDVLAIDNAQLRSSLLSRIGIEKVVQKCNGAVIEKDTIRDYELISVPFERNKEHQGDEVLMVLKVKCPSTGAFYALRVPPTMKTIDEALQWTYGNNGSEMLKVISET